MQVPPLYVLERLADELNMKCKDRNKLCPTLLCSRVQRISKSDIFHSDDSPYRVAKLLIDMNTEPKNTTSSHVKVYPMKSIIVIKHTTGAVGCRVLQGGTSEFRTSNPSPCHRDFGISLDQALVSGGVSSFGIS
jgi:hypothetical protein